jgi:hypothetical protein
MRLGRSLRKRGVTTVFAVVAVALAVPALAAAKITVPPGATEGDQYFEEAPNGGGSGSIDKGGGGGAGGSGGGAPVAATADLNKLGPEGKAAADLANANRPPTSPPSQSPVKLHPPTQNQPPAQPASSTDGEGGMGFWFPLLLIIISVAAVAYMLRRRLHPA